MRKIAFVHNLPLEYYPPACNFLDLAGQDESLEIRVYTTANRKDREAYANPRVSIERSAAPEPAAHSILRLLQAMLWQWTTARSLTRFRPDTVIYVEPHSAIAAWLYFRVFKAKGRLFIHHHEYYESGDYRRPGMRLPRLGHRLERRSLFRRAEWVSHTNGDRLRLARKDNPDVLAETWRVLPNYPPAGWATPPSDCGRMPHHSPLRLVYVGSASFADTYIEEIVRWAAAQSDSVVLHICGYNVAAEVWDWLERERFENVSCNPGGFAYQDLPGLLWNFDVGLVLYKGNTTNFVYNVPNKVFEYLRCGLQVWYPTEMIGIRNFHGQHDLPLQELDFTDLARSKPDARVQGVRAADVMGLTAESALATLFDELGIGQGAMKQGWMEDTS